MSGSILERLSARISAKPAVISIETLFHDLEDAHAEITALTGKLKASVTAAEQVPATVAADVNATGNTVAHIAPDTVAHVHTLLSDAKERLSVNALGTVFNNIESAIKLLESKI